MNSKNLLLSVLVIVAGAVLAAHPVEDPAVKQWQGKSTDDIACSHQLAAMAGLQAEHFILDHPFDVRKYRLELEPDFNDGSLTGKAVIDCISTEDDLQEVELNFVGNWDLSVSVDGTAAEYDYDGEVLSVVLPKAKDSGKPFSIEVSYEGFPQLDPNSLSTPFLIQSDFAFTHSQPYAARYWYPCFDEPSDKADDGVETLVTVPSGFLVASNGLLVEEQQIGAKRLFHWRHQYPISTYLVSVAIGPYSIISGSHGELPLRFYVFPLAAPVAARDFERHSRMLTLYEEEFGGYPFEAYGVAMVDTGDRRWAMENQTMTSYSAGLVTGDKRYELVAAHELAHMWWGDSVTIKDYRDIWLNEGFASYAEILWVESLGGESLRDVEVRNFKQLYLQNDLVNRHSLYRTNYDLRLMFSRTIYKKGGLVLHMLRWELGDDDFFDGMREYHKRFAYSGVETADFQKTMEDVSGRDLEGFFQGWVYGTGYPEYEIGSYREKTDKGDKIVITIHQIQNDPTVFAVTLPVDPDGSGPLPTRRKYVDSRWYQFSVDAESAGSDAAEIVPTEWLLMPTPTVDADYPQPVVKKIKNRRLRAGTISKVELTGRNYTPVTRVQLNSDTAVLKSVEISSDGTAMTLTIKVPKNAAKEKLGFTITNPDGDTYKKNKGLRIIPRK